MKNFLQNYLSGLMILVPIFFFPLILDSYGLGKSWFLLVAVFLGFVIWIIELLVKKERKIKINAAFGWTLVLVLWMAVFWWLGEVGVRARTLVSTPGLGVMIALLGWMFLWLQTGDDKRQKTEKWLIVSGLIVAASSLIVFLWPSAKLPIIWPKDNPIFSINQDWSLVGSILGELWLLAVLVWMSVEKLLRKMKNREGYVGQMVVTAILVLVLFLDIFKMVRSGWNYLDLNSSWIIATESLKNKPLTGVGVGNFSEAFQKWKPISFNTTKNWAATFGLSSSAWLQLWTETGLIGLGIALMIVFSGWKKQKGASNKFRYAAICLALALSPVNFVALFLVVWMLAISGEGREGKLVLKVGEAGTNVAPWLFSGLILIGVVFGTYWWTRVFLGELYLRKSMLAASKNNGGDTYNLQIKAIGMNPSSAEYRLLYSQTNMALAGTMLQKKDLSEEDKQKASTLIQQAVREAKAAVALDSKNASYWSNLAVIYKQLIGIVDGSADWSYQAYAQAVNLDAMNPSIKLDFGGLLYAAGRYEEADRVFEQIVTLKPDLANGWYNWAYSAKKLNKLGDAVNRLTQALSLVPVTSGDFDKASEELSAWKKEYEDLVKANSAQATETKEAETLKTPEALPTTNKKDQVTLPKDDLEPPTTQEVTPEVKPTAIPTGN